MFLAIGVTILLEITDPISPVITSAPFLNGLNLSSISELTNMKITSSVPYLAVDMAGAILSVPAIEFGKLGDKALLIESKFKDLDVDISGYFILIPTLESYGRILTSLGL